MQGIREFVICFIVYTACGCNQSRVLMPQCHFYGYLLLHYFLKSFLFSSMLNNLFSFVVMFSSMSNKSFWMWEPSMKMYNSNSKDFSLSSLG